MTLTCHLYKIFDHVYVFFLCSYRFKAFASVPIADKLPIFATYTFTLSTTNLRQQHLKKSKYFTCECDRCLSPTELDTHLSSFKCIKCDEGVVLPKEPLQEDTDWICSICTLPRYGRDINRVVVVLQREISDILNLKPAWVVIQELENIYDAFKKFLHPNHFTLQTIKYNLITLYSTELDLSYQNDEFLEKMIKYCTELLDLVAIIEPGQTRFRAELLFYFYKPASVLLERQTQSQEIDLKQYKKQLRKLSGQLTEVVETMKKEDPFSKEAEMGVEAHNELEVINSKVKEV